MGRIAAPTPLGGEHEQWAFDVAAGPGGMLVAGGENVWGEIRPRLWFSADGESGRASTAAPGGPLDTTGEETVRAVAPVGDGFVAVGSRHVDNEQDGMAWYSPDGETWEQLDTPTLSAARAARSVLSVTAFDGGLVAGGMSDLNGDGQGEPVVWRSADGRTWEARRPVAADERGQVGAARDLDGAVDLVRPDRRARSPPAATSWRPQHLAVDQRGRHLGRARRTRCTASCSRTA